MSTTRAPCARAIACEPSVLPLSATTTSPTTLLRDRKLRALAMQRASVSASLRQGIRTVSSIAALIYGQRRSRPLEKNEGAALGILVNEIERPPGYRCARAEPDGSSTGVLERSVRQR